jgi:hypothetical protein
MKWTIRLIFDAVPGSSVVLEVGLIERAEEITRSSVGSTIAEARALLANLQEQIVTAQLQQHAASIESCPRCGNALRSKRYCFSTLRSEYGKVGLCVRRLRARPGSGSRAQSFSTPFSNKCSIPTESRYLTAKMAALLPF